MLSAKKVLVTGGAGFIGSNFCNHSKDTYDIVALDNLFLGDRENLAPDIRFVPGDACELEDLQACGDQFDAVIHFAGTSSAPMFEGESIVWGYTNAIQSFVQALEFARATGANRFLYASTSSLYGNNPMPLLENQDVTPPNHYAITKYTYEHIARCYSRVYPFMDIVGFRFMSVYGPNEEAKGRYANIISQFLWDMARDRSPIVYGSGEQFRDFTNVADVVQALQKALEYEGALGAQVFNIGTGRASSFNDILRLLKQESGKDIEPTYIENPVKEEYIRGQHADIGRIQSVLGYEPTVTLEQGIADLVATLRPEKIRETSSDVLRGGV